jgi:vacuolar-type H+-ATPase subunit I/STV1
MSKVYRVDLSTIGVKRKTVSNGQFSLEIIHGQKMNENAITEAFPSFFKEEGEVIGTSPAKEFETTKEPVEKIVNADKVSEPVVEAVEAVKIEEKDIVVEIEETEEVVEETAVVEEETSEDVESTETIIENAKKIRTKADLEKYGIVYGIDLNRSKSLKNMLKDLVAHLEG